MQGYGPGELRSALSRLAGHGVDLDLNLGLVGREIGDVVVAFLVPIDLRDIVERISLLDFRHDFGKLDTVLRRNNRPAVLRECTGGGGEEDGQDTGGSGFHGEALVATDGWKTAWNRRSSLVQRHSGGSSPSG